MSASNGSEGAGPQLLGDAGAGRQLSIALPAELVELVAERAAANLACPTSRIYALVSARRIPHHRDGSRLLFRRAELDEWVARGGARRP
jgi:excisionase family DNA binding protein